MRYFFQYLVMVGAMFGVGGAHGTPAWSENHLSEAHIVQIADRFGLPPGYVSPGGSKEPLTAKEAGDNIVSGLKKRFDSAADPSSHLLTKSSALANGWGWAADHFQEIDRQGKGAVRFEDVLHFLGRRAAVRLPGA